MAKYGSITNYINEAYVIPLLELGVDYDLIMRSTPLSLLVIAKGYQKKIERELLNQDYLNYYSAIYVLSGIGGKLIEKPFLADRLDSNMEELTAEERTKMMREQFEIMMIKANKKIKRKEN